MRNVRLNPRQRWHEGESKIDMPQKWYKEGSTVAGVPAVMWGAMITLAREHEASRPEWKPMLGGSSKRESETYSNRIVEFAGWLFDSIKQLDTQQGWVKGKFGMARRGRGKGPDVEITVVSQRYDDMRQFLTSASLGWYDRHPSSWKREEGEPRVEPSPWMQLIHDVIQTLEKSSDRRPFDAYTYKNEALSSLDGWTKKLAVQRRRERIESDRKFRKWWDDMFDRKGQRRGRLGLLDLKVEQMLSTGQAGAQS